MGEALLELEKVLTSKKEPLTSQEANILYGCKSKAIRAFSVGAIAGGATIWAVAGKLNRFLRYNLSAGAAAACGLWSFDQSLDSCLDRILTLEGSQMQKELANIMVRKYHDDPERMKLMRKHFYTERVFDDSTSDQPKLRWRYRSIVSDPAYGVSDPAYGQRMCDNEMQSETGQQPHNSYSNQSSQKNLSASSYDDIEIEKTAMDIKQASMNPAFDVIVDPFDVVFGGITNEEIHHPSNLSASNKAQAHNRRKARRRHRIRHQETTEEE